MDAQAPESVILFDGDCSLCNRSVQFILRRDPARRFRFASLQSEAARRVLQRVGQTPEQLPDSVVLIESEKVYMRSTAALRIAGKLRGAWPLLSFLLLVPRPLRDWVYDLVAGNRYRFFGRQQSCLLPTPELRERFLEE